MSVGAVSRVETVEARLVELWQAPLVMHVAALALVLVALLPLVGNQATSSSDEGLAALQARSLSSGHGWFISHPFPEADPSGRNFPFDGTRGAKGITAFAKHPLHALVLSVADRVGGATAMVGLSIAGTIAAAGLSALIARRMSPVLSRPTLWVVGLASPLLFDAYILLAHSLAAALAALAVLSALVAIERKSALVALAVVPCVALGVFLRTETVLLGAALAVAAAVVGFRRPHWPALCVAASALVAAFGALRVEHAWTLRLIGHSVPGVAFGDAGPTRSFLYERVYGAALTWLRPSIGPGVPLARIALVLVAFMAGCLGWAIRRVDGDGSRVPVYAVLASLAATTAFLVDKTNNVGGLLIAFPVGVAGALALRRATLASTASRVAAITFAVFAVLVTATQGVGGGGAEWGGRYLAIGIPVATPVLLLALAGARARVSRVHWRFVAGSLAVCSLALGLMAVSSLHRYHRDTQFVMDLIEQVAPGNAGERPVIVTTTPWVPRLAWASFDRTRWLLSDSQGLADLLHRVVGAGQRQFTFVTNDFKRDNALLPSDVHIRQQFGAPSGDGVQILVLSAST